jgi:hypothetical protein
VRHRRGAGELHGRPAVERPVEAVEKPLPGAEQHRHDDDVQLVEQAGPQVLPHGGDAAAEPQVRATGRGPGPLQRRLHPVGDEVERRPPRRRQRLARVVGEHEDVVVERRLLAPPAAP